MSSEIRLEVVAEENHGYAPADGSAALKPSPDSLLTLRLAISAPDPAGLEALRHARRSILREEWTLGREPDEPSLESAVFSATEVSWTVPLTQRQRCRERLLELETRANRALRELRRI
jgi:hypothetical protein